MTNSTKPVRLEVSRIVFNRLAAAMAKAGYPAAVQGPHIAMPPGTTVVPEPQSAEALRTAAFVEHLLADEHPELAARATDDELIEALVASGTHRPGKYDAHEAAIGELCYRLAHPIESRLQRLFRRLKGDR